MVGSSSSHCLATCNPVRLYNGHNASSDVDTNLFIANSTRGTSTSKAKKFGISVEQVMKKKSKLEICYNFSNISQETSGWWKFICSNGYCQLNKM